MVIDFHVHCSGEDKDVQALKKECDRIGIDRCVIFGYNDKVIAAANKYPDFIIPFANLRLGEEGPRDIDRYCAQGFKGFKVIRPPARYDDESFFTTYEAVEKNQSIMLFHLGIVARANKGMGKEIGTNNDFMRPVYLDTIARRFPGLTLVGAHFGNPWSDEAAMICRWNFNLYFDFSGSLLKYRSPEYIRGLLWWDRAGSQYMPGDNKHPFQKILFGTDVPIDQMEEVKNDYQMMFDAIELELELQADVYGGNAAKLLGIEGD